MAEVLYRKPEDQPYYQGSPLKRSSHSYSSFLSHSSPQYPQRPSPPSPVPSNSHIFSADALAASRSTACPSFSHLPNRSSLPPTPASSIFSDDKEEEDHDDDIAFPSYDDGVRFYHQDEPLDLPPSPSDTSDASSVVQDDVPDEEPTPSESPLLTPTVSDDTAIKPNPSRHVDYLSHDWKEEDIWSSWRLIVSMRKQYGQKSRLENASWRTWAKSKYNLATISPETLNWLKESDVTWLYGPLQPAQSHPITQSSPDPSPNHLSSQSSFLNKKPILKKRSMSEVMLQKSLSANSLVKQAAAAVQAQQTKPKGPREEDLCQLNAEFNAGTQSRPISRDQLDYFSTISSSGNSTPCDGPKRHIRFDEKVEQCIAIECQNVFDEDDDEDDGQHSDSADSDSSDEGELTIRRPQRRRPTVGGKTASRSNSSSNKIIEKLPDTTLKSKTDSPEASRTSIHLPFMRGWVSSKLNPSASQETLRPTNPSKNFLISGDEDGDEADSGSGWTSSRSDGTAPYKARSDDLEESPSKMRRTNSGMFMPYDDEEEETAMQVGLFGRVSDTINTAKDIAHVIWNVGWRK